MSTPASQDPCRAAGRYEWIAPGLILAGLLALRIFAAFRYRFNSDETQHLHVVWGWTQGLVQYRDLFDNHPPLFHLLMAPLFRLFPERADIVVPMRLFMVPFYAASLAAVFRIGRALYGRRAGVWLAAISGALPWFFFPGTEFRPDDLYAAAWLWALAVAVEGRLTRARVAGIGFLLGVCTALTLKTALAEASLAAAAAIALAFRARFSAWRIPIREIALRMLLFGMAAAVVPGLLGLYFARQGALPALYYCVFRHNVVPHAERWGGSPWHYLYLPLALPFLAAAAGWIYRQEPNPAKATRRAMIFLVPFFYCLFLYSYWPDITPQDNLPYFPLFPCAVMALAAAWINRAQDGGLSKWWGLALPPAAVLFFVFLIFHTHEIKGSVQKYVSPIETVLRLTKPGENAMDLKGDAIYRPRPFFYIIETFTNIRLKLGWIKNDIVPGLIRTRTAICLHPPFPGPGVMAFVHGNYLPLASQPRVLVLGQQLPSSHFEIAVPGEYVFLQNGAPVEGMLDGAPTAGPRPLTAGQHQFSPGSARQPVTLFWARAWQQGYRPAPKDSGNAAPQIPGG